MFLHREKQRRTAEDTIVSARSAYQAGRYPEAIRLARLAIQQAEGVSIPVGMAPVEATVAEVAGPVQKRLDAVSDWTTLQAVEHLATGAWGSYLQRRVGFFLDSRRGRLRRSLLGSFLCGTL